MNQTNFRALNSVNVRRTIGLDKKMLDKIALTSYRINATNGKIEEILQISKGIYQVGKYVSTCSLKRMRAKVLLAKALNCKKEELVSGENELLNKVNTEYYIGDLFCNGNIPPQKYASLKVVWGNFDMMGLKDSSYLSHLSVIGGNGSFSYCTDLYLPSLQYVFGDLHIENLDDICGLFNLKFVGGKVYHKGNIFDFNSFIEYRSHTISSGRKYMLLKNKKL